MDEVNSIIQDLNNIITELEQVESDLRSKFKGIYTDHIADIVHSKIEDYYKARGKLQTIDRSQVNEG